MALSQDEQRNVGLSLQTGGSVIGGAIGGIYGNAPGAVAGASAGGALGSLAAQGIGLFFGEQDQTLGPSGEQRSIAAMSLEQAQRASEQRGLSQQQAARMSEAGSFQGRELLQFATALEMSKLSPLERDVLAKNITEKVRQRQRKVSEAITTADIEATTRNLAQARQATAEAQRQAQIIRQMEVAKEDRDKKLQAAAEENFIKSVGQTATSVTKLVGVIDEESNADRVASEADKDVASSSGVVAAIPNVGGGVFDKGSAFSPEDTEAINAVDSLASVEKLYDKELREMSDFYNASGLDIEGIV